MHPNAYNTHTHTHIHTTLIISFMVGERWLSSGLGGSWRGGVSGRTFSPAGGVRSEEALELAEATEKADSREEMFEEMPERRSLEVWSADRRRVRRNPPPLSFVVAVILQPGIGE